ncbi:MAG: hypothetical protein K2R98_21670 [Gemmataceae bacterium]|nr:hypothetical protein [Gemmataceae bacterium]
MSQYCYVIVNNGGYSWAVRGPGELEPGRDTQATMLPQLLQEGWIPVREAPMGGGTSQVAHVIVLLEKPDKPEKVEKAKPVRASKPGK